MKFSRLLLAALALACMLMPGGAAAQKKRTAPKSAPSAAQAVQPAAAETKEEDARISAEELRAKMEKGESLVVLDVRTQGQYQASTNRIKGDIRFDLATEDDPAAKLKGVPPDRLIVTYCT